MPLDEKAMAARVKAQLRKRLRQLRSTTPTQAAERCSASIVDQVLDLREWGDAVNVALFWPMKEKREVDVVRLDGAARGDGKRVAYPFMRPSDGGFSTGFAWVEDPSVLEDGGHGFREPPPAALAARGDELDLIVVPALAVAPTGHRVGFGRGWYDATLGEFRPKATLIVVAFEFQLLMEVPVEEHDIACDYVVTEKRVIVVDS